jgi:hypothetical protein
MTKPITLKQNRLLLEGIIFTEVAKKFCNTITEETLFKVKKNLELCLDELPVLVRDYINTEDRITRIRKLIQLQAVVDECKEYLEFMARTKKGDINSIILELNNFTEKFEEFHYSSNI